MVKTILFLIGVLALAGCGKSGQQEEAVAMAEATIKVETVKCDMCVANITNALEKIEGIKEVEVNLKQKTARVGYVSSRVTLASIESAIAEAGYNANSTVRNEEAYRSLPECCR